MDPSFYFRGLVIGLSIAAAVGPIAVLVMRRTLTQGRVAGLVSGLGVATADGLYGAIGGFGLTFISSLLVEQNLWLRIIGGCFMCYLGVKIVLADTTVGAAKTDGRGLAGLYLSTFLLTLTNPMTILSFAVIMAGLGAGSTNGNYGATAILIAGVFSGSALWWVILTTGLGLLHGKISPNVLRWINRISGSVIFLFGLGILISLINF